MNNFKREKSDFPKTTLFVLKKNYALYPTWIARSQLKRPFCPCDLTHVVVVGGLSSRTRFLDGGKS